MKKLASVFIAILVFGCNNPQIIKTEAQEFIDAYTEQYLKYYEESSNAEWEANTEIIPGDTTNDVIARRASEAMAKYTGSVEVITKAKNYLKHKEILDPIQIKQLEGILYRAANNPQTVPDIVKKRIAAETEQNSKLFGYQFMLMGDSVSPNKLDNLLGSSNNLEERLAAWEASKEVGKELKDGLENLRKLRNATVRDLDYPDYFSYQVSDYNLSTADMMSTMDQLIQDVWPLYRELHTYARYELAKKYGVNEVPDMLPAHWLPNRWGQDWSAMVEVEGLDLDAALKDKNPEWIVKTGEEFYKSLGFPSLPKSFYEKSSLYPFPDDSVVKKNTHASAWHMDLQNDVRSLMSVEPNASWWETVHHELGHVYYFMAYSNDKVPPLLREGANRAYHEAVGSLIGLASMQAPYLKGRGLIDKNAEADKIAILLKEALNYVVFIPFSAGTMSNFEKQLYADGLPKNEFNSVWWNLVKKYQGIVPPNARGEEYCDAATKTHINNDAAQYYDYALSYVLLFQMHNHISTKILNQDPTATDYFGSKETGEFLNGILEKGATEDWNKVLKESTGEEINAKAMLNYFAPLMEWLKKENQGRNYTLPESI
ncbi:M2 family metallopeptidase [Luteibaculum oceani]|uniref:M2 family metallopeptidase n=1 Tax=Luteibaculum oceani TaxID=1294296 RepID=A0A5C6VJB4_9FLAO|nr:M2 family metallopeptidase [Luteibaculum oceani]TXC85347.1 M2 family metallopeptidase [Luteibaculum oceani]